HAKREQGGVARDSRCDAGRPGQQAALVPRRRLRSLRPRDGRGPQRIRALLRHAVSGAGSGLDAGQGLFPRRRGLAGFHRRRARRRRPSRIRSGDRAIHALFGRASPGPAHRARGPSARVRAAAGRGRGAPWPLPPRRMADAGTRDVGLHTGPNKTDSRGTAFVLLALATLFWAGNWVLGRALRETFEPNALNLWRWLIASIALA